MNNNLLFFAPLFFGYLGSYLCPMSSKIRSNRLVGRPPGFIFRIVWPILYLIIGYTWMKENRKEINIIYSINTLLSFLWLFFFSCQKNPQNSLYILLLMIATSYMMIYTNKTIFNKVLLSLYTTWLHFALILNFDFIKYNLNNI